MRLATDSPISQYRPLRRAILSFHPHSLEWCDGGKFNWDKYCGLWKDSGQGVAKLHTSNPTPPAQAEAKAEICWLTVNDAFLVKNWPFEALQHSDNRFCRTTIMNTPGNAEFVLPV